jgi:hypothetical protein
MDMKPGAMREALKDQKVVVVQERSTGKAVAVTKVTKNHVVIQAGVLGDPVKLKMKDFKRRFNAAAVSRGTRGSFPETI